MSDLRAKDLLGTLKPRRGLADRLLERVGFRAWERPRVSVSARIFKLYRLQDPFDPNSPSDQDTVGLGPVTLRLGEKKRQPAPHALPKEERKPALPKVPPGGAPPPGAPAPRAPAPPPAAKPPVRPTPPPPAPAEAAPAQPLGYVPKQYESKKPARPPGAIRPTPPAPKPTPAPASSKASATAARSSPSAGSDESGTFSYIPKQYAPKPKPAGFGDTRPPIKPAVTTSSGAFGPGAERKGLVGKLPVRPEIQTQAAPAGTPTVRREVAPVEPARHTVAPVAPGPPRGTLTRSGRLTLGAATVVTADPVSAGPEVIEVQAPRPEPVRAEPARSEPVRAEPPRAEPSPPPAPRASASIFDDELPPPPKAAPKPPPSRTPPRPPMPGQKSGDGLDDLFAASAQEGRMRIGKAKAVTGVSGAEEAAEKPKRAPVALPKPVLPGELPKPRSGD